jgi:uncharacterized protein (TIGR02145 family)
MSILSVIFKKKVKVMNVFPKVVLIAPLAFLVSGSLAADAEQVIDQVKQLAVTTAESNINEVANDAVNSFGNGNTEVSIFNIESGNPGFSIKTIQPLTTLNKDSKSLIFTQGSIASGENNGDRRATINLGIGQRYLLEDGQSIAGINLFTDYETESKHSRASLGLEYQRANFSANVNQYHPLSDKVVIGEYTEEPLAGYDIRLTGQVPYLPWAKIKANQYHWDAITGDNIKGTRLGIEVDINAATTFEIGTENSNTASRAGYAQLRIQFPYKANTAPTQFKIASKAFADSDKLSLTDLNYVERSNKIKVEKLLNEDANEDMIADGVAYSTIVIGTQRWTATNVSIEPTANNTLGVDYWTAYTGSGGTAANEDGYYYTWEAAKNVCPSGWRLSSDSDFAILEEAVVAGPSGIDWLNTQYRGPDEAAALKVGGSSGFDAKYAGYRGVGSVGSFTNRGNNTHWWTSTAGSGGRAYKRQLFAGFDSVERALYDAGGGFSVRCLKD